MDQQKEQNTVIAMILWAILITILVTTFACAAEATHVKKVEGCGGWENYLQVVVTQEDQTKCIAKSNVVTENCYHVWIQVQPGPKDQCTFEYNVMQSKVDNLVKKFMQEYMP